MSSVCVTLPGMTDAAESTAETVALEVYVEAHRPIAGGRWEILPDDTVRYIRPNGQTVQPAIIATDGGGCGDVHLAIH
jgi:hypothetical protein